MRTMRRTAVLFFRRHILQGMTNLQRAIERVFACIGFGDVGMWGELQALRYLRRSRVIPLQRNWRYRAFEADIIALEGRTLVVVEVKTRHSRLRHNFPGRGAITPRKQDHLRKLLHAYVRNHGPLLRRLGVSTHRLDTIEVYYTEGALNRHSQNGVLWQRNAVALQPHHR